MDAAFVFSLVTAGILFFFVFVAIGIIRVMRGGSENPDDIPQATPKQHTRMPYPVLRLISICFLAFGWICIGISILAIVALISILATALSQGGIGFGIFSLPTFGSIALGFFVGGLMWVAFGEMIRVFVDIALNTHRIYQHLHRD